MDMRTSIYLAEVQARLEAIADYEKQLLEWIEAKRSNAAGNLDVQRFVVNAYADIKTLLGMIGQVEPTKQTQVKIFEGNPRLDLSDRVNDWLKDNYSKVTSTHLGHNPFTRDTLISIVTEGDPKLFGDNVREAILLKDHIEQNCLRLMDGDLILRRGLDPSEVRAILDKYLPGEQP